MAICKYHSAGVLQGMHAAGSFLAVLFSFLLVLLLFPSYAAADDDRSFTCPEVLIEAEVLSDGSMLVAEKRTFNLRGRWRGMTQRIRLTPGVDFTDVLVSEGGAAYEQKPPGTIDIPGIFFVDRDNKYFYIDWSFDAYNQVRTFVISYRVENAVVVHQDVAELYWQFIGDETDARIDYARVNLTLPPGAAGADLLVWGHGPLYGEVWKEGADRVVWEVEALPRKTYLEGRVVFPAELVPESTNLSGREALPGILQEEDKLARRADLQRTIHRMDYLLGPALFLALLIVYVVLRRKSTTDPEAYRGDYYRELPGDYSPAEAGYLFRLGKTKSEDFTATVMDLARRGHLRLEEYRGETGRIRKRSFTDYRIIPEEGRGFLAKHEQELFSFIFNKIGGTADNGVTFKEIERFAKRNKNSAAVYYQSWSEEVKKQARARGFFGGTAWAGIITGLASFVAGLILIFTQIFFVTGIVAVTTGPFLVAATLLLSNLTPTGADHFAKWRAFRRFLLHFSNLDRSTVPSLEVWEHYLVYAVSLGVAKQVIQQLQVVYPQLREGTYVFGSTWAAMAMSDPGRFDAVSSALQKSFRTATSSSSSSSGGGGGFSGGGGGGGGGGGFSGR